MVPRAYPALTTRRVHVAEWVEGEKLSQSDAGDVSSLVAVGMIAYLTQVSSPSFPLGPPPCASLRLLLPPTACPQRSAVSSTSALSSTSWCKGPCRAGSGERARKAGLRTRNGSGPDCNA